ncbi:hypothetical protein LTR27_005047 [Elasticomyces elasticus]|nr:hypothetical protein LTR27_005047 [Elasticomyces elasticus]
MTDLCSGQSTVAPQQDDHFRLLDLPPEMVGHIFSFLGVHDLPSLRLVSHDVASLGFGRFADNYLFDLSCHFRDPVRLQRLYNIVSAPSLKDRVRRITFTVNPDEGAIFDAVPVVPASGETLATTQHKTWALRCESDGLRLHDQPLDTIFTSAILAKIYNLNALVALDFNDTSYYYKDRSVEANF